MSALETDVLMIGGGPAGLAAAIAARLQGFQVTLIDAACPPIDKACGEGVLPDGVEVLRRLGVHIHAGEGFPLRGIRFVDRGLAVEAGFPSAYGLGVRRTNLHRVLHARASALGVKLLWNTRFADRSKLPRCRWIVGADGANSRVRHAAGLNASAAESLRFGFRRHYRLPPWTDFVEIHWGLRGQVYVTPVSQDEIGIALLSRDSSLRLDRALEEFPELQKKLRGARASTTERGGVTVSRRLRNVCRGDTALIGDASGSVDAITGDGLSLSFHQAVALSRALVCGDLAAYQAEHRRLARRPAWMGELLLGLDRFPVLRRSAMRLMAFEPPILARLLAIHAPASR